jgi:hypothetical protein
MVLRIDRSFRQFDREQPSARLVGGHGHLGQEKPSTDGLALLAPEKAGIPQTQPPTSASLKLPCCASTVSLLPIHLVSTNDKLGVLFVIVQLVEGECRIAAIAGLQLRKRYIIL